MPLTVRGLLEDASASLSRSEALLLLSHHLKCPRESLIAHPEREIDETIAEAFRASIAKATTGYPIPYIIGKQSFWQWDFTVTPDTLIPRPDTETLIEVVLDHFLEDAPLRVLDLGTGPGTIAITLALLRPRWNVSAIDCSASALAVAALNARNLHADVAFYESNWFDAVPSQPFDLIVSNPPYIRDNDIHLPALRFEPKLALTSGIDGLDAIRRITALAPTHLTDGGALLFETGYDQGEAVRALFAKAGFKRIETLRDLGNRDRVTLGYRT